MSPQKKIAKPRRIYLLSSESRRSIFNPCQVPIRQIGVRNQAYPKKLPSDFSRRPLIVGPNRTCVNQVGLTSSCERLSWGSSFSINATGIILFRLTYQRQNNAEAIHWDSLRWKQLLGFQNKCNFYLFCSILFWLRKLNGKGQNFIGNQFIKHCKGFQIQNNDEYYTPFS